MAFVVVFGTLQAAFAVNKLIMNRV
jgi:hypothetical protein